MKIRRDKYQQGSIRRVKRANGFAWEFRYYVEQDGKRVLRSQYFDGVVPDGEGRPAKGRISTPQAE